MTGRPPVEADDDSVDREQVSARQVEPINIALVGLGFGAEFVPIYRDHPDVGSVAICDADPRVVRHVGDRFGIAERYLSLDAVLEQQHIDAVHLVTALPDHGRQSIAVLEAGKHCASTVPMALDIDDMRRIVELQASAGRNYMMMETAVYTREFLHCQELFGTGVFGPVTFAKGVHYQDMEGWPWYWNGLPPMWYMTHAISPVLRLMATRAASVRCLGSGSLPPHRQPYGNPYPAETAMFELQDSSVTVEVSRTLFQAARAYTEAFAIYGEHYGFEWPQIEDEPPVHFRLAVGGVDGRGRTIEAQRVPAPDRADLLPPAIAPYTRASVHSDGSHASFVQGGGHGGSHPHLVHEFVRSIVERRPAAVDAVTAANWTAPGVMAHMSAMQGGKPMDIPNFG